MTAPVETRYPVSTLEAGEIKAPNERGEAKVSFLYRSTDVYPEQIAEDIQVEEIAPMTVISLGLKGSYDYKSYQQSIERLQDWLAQHSEYAVVVVTPPLLLRCSLYPRTAQAQRNPSSDSTQR